MPGPTGHLHHRQPHPPTERYSRRENHIDIADWLIRYKTARACHSERSPQGGVEESPRRHCVDFLKAARFIDPEHHAELEALIEDFDLEFWGAEKVSEETSDEVPP